MNVHDLWEIDPNLKKPASWASVSQSKCYQTARKIKGQEMETVRQLSRSPLGVHTVVSHSSCPGERGERLDKIW